MQYLAGLTICADTRGGGAKMSKKCRKNVWRRTGQQQKYLRQGVCKVK